jgi:alkaline phosphatase D
MTRSFFCGVIALLYLYACGPKKEKSSKLVEATAHLRQTELKPFYHGVASGDPTPNSVILWTRVSPDTQLTEIEVQWELALDATFAQIIQKGSFSTDGGRDYTVKIEATGLEPNTHYFYRFHALEGTSQTGRTKTSGAPESLRFAVVSCSNYEAGYFNAYARIAEEPELDAVIHLGDYIYEYGVGVYGDTTIGRKHIPIHEIVSLQDYRERYSQYRLDPDLRAVHGNHPFIVIWDDHEITNNAYVDGAQNHQAEEGKYSDRRSAARKAYYEWMPIREQKEHYRKLSYGPLADVLMLDERLEGRTKQADSLADPTLSATDRQMLGDTQLAWLQNGLTQSGARWKLIGNQVTFSKLQWGYDSFNTNLDAWDGYPAEQQKVAQIITENHLENVVFLTGDTHRAWAFESTIDPKGYNPETGAGAIAIELGTTSITSDNANERQPGVDVTPHEKKITGAPLNPHLKYVNSRDHGYLLLTLTDSLATADFKVVKTLRKTDPQIVSDTMFTIVSGRNRLSPVGEK